MRFRFSPDSAAGRVRGTCRIRLNAVSFGTLDAMKTGMNLQTQRRLEQFLRLAELPVVRIDTRMEFAVASKRFYLELVGERAVFTLTRPIESVHRDASLRKLLRLTHPSGLQGVPLRAFTLSNRLALSCAPAPFGDGPHWLHCYRTMSRMLDASSVPLA